MIGAMCGVAVACLLTIANLHFAIAAAGIVMVGVARPAFDIAMQAWFADRVPYGQRGRVYGISELNWSLSLVVVPVAAYLIVWAGWRAPFVFVALMALGGAFVVMKSVNADRPAHGEVSIRLQVDRRLISVLVSVGLFNLAAELIFVVYGQWLEGPLGLSIAGIGMFTLAILGAEFIGAGIVALVSDAFGLRKMWMLGLLATALIYLMFPLVGRSVVGAIAVVVLWIATYEVSYVASVPFISEMSTARDRVLSSVVLSVGVGRAVGAIVAQPLFASGGIGLSAVAAASCTFLGFLILIGIPEHLPRSDLHGMDLSDR